MSKSYQIDLQRIEKNLFNLGKYKIFFVKKYII